MRKFLPLILILIVIGAYFYVNSQKTVTQKFPDSEAQLLFFWGDGCPHCENVKNYIKDNNLETKVKIAYKEVYMDQNNRKLLEATIQKCPEIDTSRGIGVPLAFDTQNSKCFYGDIPIIEWLKAR
jgi:glutaredoxin